MDNPLISIVIANYNYGRFLEAAIQSVMTQDMGDNVELIICDAVSTDNSVDIIKKYACGLPPNTHRYGRAGSAMNSSLISWWCSEKDGGQSAAFNKGFSHARGEWLTWLNADDLLMPGTLKEFSRLVEQKPEAEWVTGNMLYFDSETGKIMQVNWGPHIKPPFLRRGKSFYAVFGPTTFWKKSLYDKVGPIDEKLHYAMDTEYWVRMTMAGVKQYRLNHICWGFRKHDESKTVGLQKKEIVGKRKREEQYWRTKTGYWFHPNLSNVWYLLWIIWRVIDGSWLVRYICKHRMEKRKICDLYKELRMLDQSAG